MVFLKLLPFILTVNFQVVCCPKTEKYLTNNKTQVLDFIVKYFSIFRLQTS